MGGERGGRETRNAYKISLANLHEPWKDETKMPLRAATCGDLLQQKRRTNVSWENKTQRPTDITSFALSVSFINFPRHADRWVIMLSNVY
jgi:hypothetical protein